MYGNKLGEGSQGEVYSYTPSANRVVKFSIIYDYYFLNSLDKRIKKFFSILEELKNNTSNLYPKIYDYDLLVKSNRKVVDGDQDLVIYYYIMEKLNSISEDENKVFYSILSHQDNNKKHYFTEQTLNSTLNGLSLGLNFNKDKVNKFYFDILNSKYHHPDITGRNIMKDYYGNFKLVDLDDLKLKEM